jgi:hypothetical protein
MFLGFPRNVSSVMFLGFPRNISSYVPWCHVSEEHNLCSSVLMSMRTYVRQDMFLGHKHMFLDFWLRNICLFLVVVYLCLKCVLMFIYFAVCG